MQKQRKLSVRHLVAATYFMVAGGPYGLEEMIGAIGYYGAIIALLVTPVIWSLPTAFMVSELSSALPEEGGYYAWVKRGLGPFWGFQEAWLSLMASIFDMAIYPTLFVLYFGRLWPAVASGPNAVLAGLAMIAACTVWNLRGSRAVGSSSLAMSVLLLAPFAALAIAGFARPAAECAPDAKPLDLTAALMVAMWNCKGWDNASTVEGEVDHPQRTYPVAMIGTVVLVAVTSLIPVAAVAAIGIPLSVWSTGAWVEVGGVLAGKWLAVAVVIGGMVWSVGGFNALVMSYTRVPPALARDGFLPTVFTQTIKGSGAPWVSILACAACWAACLGMGFSKLVALNVMLYGLSLLLEFVALVALRIREPNLKRPFKVWGGLVGAILVGAAPMALIGLALLRNRNQTVVGMNVLLLGGLLIAAGPLLYGVSAIRKRWWQKTE